MGGEKEQTLKKEKAKTEDEVMGQTLRLGGRVETEDIMDQPFDPGEFNIDAHISKNAETGDEMHFHDRAAKLKNAMPIAVWLSAR